MRSPLVTVILLAGGGVAATPAIAEDGGAPASGVYQEEIVVTARKRSETLISTPVVVSALSSDDIEKRAINSLDSISRAVPQLIIAPAGGSVQGGNIAMRGISGPDNNPFGDQAVSFNIDGVQVAKTNVRRMAEMDIEQVEVLKGPQALFFGKNSPAGIVLIRTADPTPDFQAKVSVGYEFEAHEIRSEGFVSTPLGDDLGFRLAGYYSRQRGDLTDITPIASPYAPEHAHGDWRRDFAVRGTLKWTPTADLTARFKLAYARTRTSGPGNTTQIISCPFGFKQTGAIGDCSPGEDVINSSSGPFVGTVGDTLNEFGDGHNFLRQKQILGSLQIDYNLADSLSVTSVTGYYYVNLHGCQNYVDYVILLPACIPMKDREWSQEFRATSDFDGPINFAAGLFFADTKASTGADVFLFGGDFDLIAPGVGGPTSPLLVLNYFLKQRTKAYSAYAQLIYKPIEVLEIDVGGRYSYEKKRLPLVRSSAGPILDSSADILVSNPAESWSDFSPEVTVSYRPSNRLTLFASYKHGFLSGGFNSDSVAFADGIDLSYDPQTIEGFEAGVKAETADRRLRVNAAVYTYRVNDLQVTSYANISATIRNVGSVNIKGVEADFTYRTPLEGLTIGGAAAYNRGRYDNYPVAPCYAGQTPAMGCHLIAGQPTQDLSGTELVRAPKWNLSANADYETLVGGLKLGLFAGVMHSSSLLTDPQSDPRGRQRSYTLVDASARIGAPDDRWELAIIGRNLTNKRYFAASTNVPFTGAGAGLPSGILGDRQATVSRGREMMARITYRFGN